MNAGTAGGGGLTKVGNDGLFMAGCHVAHDCQIGSHTIIANFSGLAGHVHLGDWAIVGGLTGIHQFCKIGAHVMIGSSSAVAQDVPPYLLVDGNPLAVRGFNIEGLRRRGFDADRIGAVKQMHRLLYRQQLTLEQSREAISRLAVEVPGAAADVRLMVDFLAQSSRGIAR